MYQLIFNVCRNVIQRIVLMELGQLLVERMNGKNKTPKKRLSIDTRRFDTLSFCKLVVISFKVLS